MGERTKCPFGNGTKAAKNKASDTRLAWLVDFERDRIQAKGQTYGKNGWTKGRPIAFDRLKKGEIKYMSPQDMRIVNAVQYAFGSEINIRGNQEIWKQLVGHPIIVLWKSPEVAVQLIATQPSLVAREYDDGYQVKFSHDIHKAGVQIIKESPTRYLLLDITEQMIQIAKALNGKSLHVPEEGTERLKEVISGLSNIVKIQSAFEDENLPTIEADARPCVHLLPVGDGFHVEVYAKPFGNIPPYVKIAQGEPIIIAPVEGVRTSTTRNLKAEKENLQNLKKEVEILRTVRPAHGVWKMEDAEQCLQLLLQLEPLLQSEKIILEWPKGEKFRISQIVGFDQFQMKIKEKNNWFEVSGQIPI